MSGELGTFDRLLADNGDLRGSADVAWSRHTGKNVSNGRRVIPTGKSSMLGGYSKRRTFV